MSVEEFRYLVSSLLSPSCQNDSRRLSIERLEQVKNSPNALQHAYEYFVVSEELYVKQFAAVLLTSVLKKQKEVSQEFVEALMTQFIQADGACLQPLGEAIARCIVIRGEQPMFLSNLERYLPIERFLIILGCIPRIWNAARESWLMHGEGSAVSCTVSFDFETWSESVFSYLAEYALDKKDELLFHTLLGWIEAGGLFHCNLDDAKALCWACGEDHDGPNSAQECLVEAISSAPDSLLPEIFHIMVERLQYYGDADKSCLEKWSHAFSTFAETCPAFLLKITPESQAARSLMLHMLNKQAELGSENTDGMLCWFGAVAAMLDPAVPMIEQVSPSVLADFAESYVHIFVSHATAAFSKDSWQECRMEAGEAFKIWVQESSHANANAFFVLSPVRVCTLMGLIKSQHTDSNQIMYLYSGFLIYLNSVSEYAKSFEWHAQILKQVLDIMLQCYDEHTALIHSSYQIDPGLVEFFEFQLLFCISGIMHEYITHDDDEEEALPQIDAKKNLSRSFWIAFAAVSRALTNISSLPEFLASVELGYAYDMIRYLMQYLAINLEINDDSFSDEISAYWELIQRVQTLLEQGLRAAEVTKVVQSMPFLLALIKRGNAPQSHLQNILEFTETKIIRQHFSCIETVVDGSTYWSTQGDHFCSSVSCLQAFTQGVCDLLKVQPGLSQLFQEFQTLIYQLWRNLDIVRGKADGRIRKSSILRMNTPLQLCLESIPLQFDANALADILSRSIMAISDSPNPMSYARLCVACLKRNVKDPSWIHVFYKDMEWAFLSLCRHDSNPGTWAQNEVSSSHLKAIMDVGEAYIEFCAEYVHKHTLGVEQFALFSFMGELISVGIKQDFSPQISKSSIDLLHTSTRYLLDLMLPEQFRSHQILLLIQSEIGPCFIRCFGLTWQSTGYGNTRSSPFASKLVSVMVNLSGLAAVTGHSSTEAFQSTILNWLRHCLLDAHLVKRLRSLDWESARQCSVAEHEGGDSKQQRRLLVRQLRCRNP